MERVNIYTLASVRTICNRLDDDELAGLLMVATLGTNPTNYPWYEKVKSCFTQNNNIQVHIETLSAINIIADERLGSKNYE